MMYQKMLSPKKIEIKAQIFFPKPERRKFKKVFL